MLYNKCFRYLTGVVKKPRVSIYRHAIRDSLNNHIRTENISAFDENININNNV